MVIEALYGAGEAFFKPAQTGLRAADRARGRDPGGQGGERHDGDVAEFTGPALATALVLGVGAGWAFALDALTFLVSIAFLLRVQAARARRGPGAPAAGSRDLARGLAGRPLARVAVSILLCFSAAVLFAVRAVVHARPEVSEDVYGSSGVVRRAVRGARRGHDRAAR